MVHDSALFDGIFRKFYVFCFLIEILRHNWPAIGVTIPWSSLPAGTQQAP